MYSSPFSLFPFSTRLEAVEDVYDAMSFVETITAIVGITDIENDAEFFRAEVSAVVNLASALLETSAFDESISCAADAIATIVDEETLSEAIAAIAVLEADSYDMVSLNEIIHTKLAIGANTAERATFREAVHAVAAIGSHIRETVRFDEFINVLITVKTTTQDVIDINITIPPGGELIINSDNYTATIDGVNVLHLYTGAWLYIDSEVVGVSVSAGGGVPPATVTSTSMGPWKPSPVPL